MEDGFGHIIKKGVKHLEEAFLEMKFDSDNLYTISRKPKPAFFFRKYVLVSAASVEKGAF